MGPAKAEAGLTLLEVLVVVAILGLGVSIASLNLDPIGTPLQAGTSLLEGHFRQVRTRAIATTAACRVIPQGFTAVIAECAASCTSGGWTTEDGLRIDLPDGVKFEDPNWAACFSSRGITTQNQTVGLAHSEYGTAKVEVMLGGTTRVIH